MQKKIQRIYELREMWLWQKKREKGLISVKIDDVMLLCSGKYGEEKQKYD